MQDLAKIRVPNKSENGADESRTHDLLHAMQALSQLSYGPLSGSRPIYRYYSPPP